MSAIAALLRPFLPWLLLSGLMFGLLGWAKVERSWRQSAEADLAEAQADLAKARSVIAGRDRAIAALQEQATARTESASQQQIIVRRVYAAPTSRACVESAPVRALLDGLRRPAAPADAGSARSAPQLPPGAPAAR